MKTRPDEIVYCDRFKSYDERDVSEFRHIRIDHSKLFANGWDCISEREFLQPWQAPFA